MPRSVEPTGSRNRVGAGRPQRARIRYDRRITIFTALTWLSGGAAELLMLWVGDYTPIVQWTVTLFVVVSGLTFGGMLLNRVVFPLRAVSNMLAALREGDFSMQAHGARYDDALGEVLFEVNELGGMLREQRLSGVEATALLRKVVAEIDVAVCSISSLIPENGSNLSALQETTFRPRMTR